MVGGRRLLWSGSLGRAQLAVLTALIFLVCPASAQNDRWSQLVTAARQFYAQGKYEQDLPVAQESLRLADQAFGGESRQTAISVNDVAMALKALDRLADAEPLYRRALATNQKLLGPGNPELADVDVSAEFRNPGRRSVGLLIRVIVVRPPERWEVPAEVQFEVAPNTVTDVTNLRTARLRTW